MTRRDAAAFILSIIVVLGCIGIFAVAGELSKHADPCEWVELDLCHAKTGKLVKDVPTHGLHVLGSATIRQKTITDILPLKDVEGCSLIITSAGATAAVMGTVDDLMKKLNKPECGK